MSNQTKQPVLPRIQDFYEGKSVFITGATGYLGVVLLESILRLCPGIERVYLLMREKKGVKPEKRKEFIFNKAIFNKLKKSNPDAFKKVHIIPGDVSQPDLGMDEISLLKVIQNVEIVFHCAASISFLRPLKFLLVHNSGATHYVLEVCRKLKNLNALVYTSTAFANSNRMIEIEEEIYRLPFRANKFLDELFNGKDESLQQLVNQCQPEWPNHYTFSKCLAENIILDNASDLPTAIVRPSLITSIWKEPLPYFDREYVRQKFAFHLWKKNGLRITHKGYVEDTSGITAISVGVGKGFIKVLHGDPDAKFDFIPVDVVAQTHLVAAMKAALDKSLSPRVINCTSNILCTLGEFTDCMVQLVKKHPLPNTFRTPNGLKIEKGYLKYWLTFLFEHYIPAYVFDIFLKMSGSKIRLCIKYKFLGEAISATHYFMSNSWDYQTENFEKLFMDIHPEDKQILGTSCKGGSVTEMADKVAVSGAFFQWDTDKKSKADRMRSADQRFWITIVIQCAFTAAVSALTYLTMSSVYQFIHHS